MSVRLALAVPDVKIVRVLPDRPRDYLASLADGITTSSATNIRLLAPGGKPFSIAIIGFVDPYSLLGTPRRVRDQARLSRPAGKSAS